mgnify:CR=1 FL=1
MRRLRLNLKRFTSGLMGGAFRSSQRGGGGYELREIKEFQPEEDFSAIHLLTSAKRGTLFMVLREPERAARVIFLMDISRSGKFGSSGISKEALQTSLLTILGEAASEGTNQIGVIAFTNRIEKSWKPYVGLGKFLGRIFRASAFTDLGNSTDIKTAVEFVSRLRSKPDLVILCSDFLAEENYRDAIFRLKRKNDLICLITSDPRERELKPPFFGVIATRDLESGKSQFAGGVGGKSWPGEELLKSLSVDYDHFSTSDDKNVQWQKLYQLFEKRRGKGVGLG